jgi:hypothetical protein
MKTLKFVSINVLAFIVGIYYGCYLYPLIQVDNQVPIGKWESFYFDNDLTLQLNTSQAKFNKNTVTTWIREDRVNNFDGSLGVSGKTIFSKVLLNCDDLTSIVYEQKSFDIGMVFSDSKEEKEPLLGQPKELMSAISLITLCGIGKSKPATVNKTETLLNV